MPPFEGHISNFIAVAYSITPLAGGEGKTANLRAGKD
jgi:hypothetical protein